MTYAADGLGNEAGNVKQAKRARDLVLKAFQRLSVRTGLEEELADLESAMEILKPLAEGIELVDSGDPALVALKSVINNKHVPTEVQLDLMPMVEDLDEVGEGARPRLWLGMFRLLNRWSLLDPKLAKESHVSFHKAGTWLATQLEKTGHITVERLKDVKTIAEAMERCGEENVELADVLVAPGGGEVASVHWPCLRVEDDVYQKALVLRGVPTDDAVAVEFDEVLFNTERGLRQWQATLHLRVRGMMTEVQRQILERAIKRIGDVRATMHTAAAGGGPVAPPETARRDVTKLAIDMVHRVQDTLATLPQHREAYRGAFSELMFKDVVYRQLVPYLSDQFGIALDTAVVEGADAQALSGRYKEELKGPKPKHKNKTIFSVVIPGYQMGGTNIREAMVRLGVF